MKTNSHSSKRPLYSPHPATIRGAHATRSPKWSNPKWLTGCLAAVLLSLAGVASAGQIGVNFMTGGNDGNTNGNLLLPYEWAGAGIYAQQNWNNVAGALGTNVVLFDTGSWPTPVAISWASPNTWSQSGNTTANQGTPDANLMNGYLDNNGNANVAISNPYNMFSTTTPANNNRNWPMVYLTGLNGWMASQGAAAYDVVIYSDGDATSGRTGEYWAANAIGMPDNLTVGADASTHAFLCDLNNFISALAYAEVPNFIQSGAFSGGLLAEFGNFPGDFTVITSLTGDSVLLRSQRYNSRAPINAIQIIPRTILQPATFAGLYDAPVYLGGIARFAPKVAGATPMTFQWLKNNIPLTDGGNIAGATNSTLTVSSVTSSDIGSYALRVMTPQGLVTSGSAALTVVTPVANGYPEKIATNRPANYWRFNETSDPSTGWTPAYDAIGGCTATYGTAALNGLAGIAGPTPTDWPGFESGNLGYQSSRAARLTYLMAPPLLLNTNTATVLAWIYPTAAQGGFTGLIFTRGVDVAGFGYGNNNMLGYTWNSNNAATYNFVSGLVPLTNAWNFVALAVSPSNAILYCYNTNGQFSATNSITHSNEFWGGPTYIGADAPGGGITTPQNRAFVGTIDEVSVFNRTLSPAEIYNYYKKGLGLSAIGPSISIQPQSTALYEGRTARFSVTASGDSPLTYTWRTNGVPVANGGRYSGANTSTLTISNVVVADSASIDVVVGNIVGSLPSAAVSLTVVASSSLPAPYEAKLRELNPISYWRLNEPAGSPYSYDYWGGIIAANENAVLGVPGPAKPDFSGLETANTAAQYDGLTADTATSASLLNNRSQFSIVGWFNTADIIGTRVGLFGQNDIAEFGFHGTDASGQAVLGLWTPYGGAYLGQSTNVIPGVWYMIAGVGTGTNVSIILVSTNGGGGFQVVQSSGAGTTTNYGQSTYSFKIGGGGVLDATGNYFTGLIDEVAVFDRALSVGELSDLFGAALLGGELPPAIAAQPASQTLYAGLTATFSVSAVGTSPHYQWRANGVPIADGGNIAGATTPALTINNISAADALSYDVVITNRVGFVISSNATLTVITPVPGSYEANVIALKPWAYYRLNELDDPSTGAALAHDYYGGHDGLYATAAQDGFNGVFGPINPPFGGFSATNTAMQTTAGAPSSYATAPIGSLSTNTVTFTAWLYPIGLQTSWAGLLVNRNSGVAGGWGYNDQQMLSYTWNNNTTWSYVSGLVIPSNQWSFVAVSISPTQAVLYVGTTNGLVSATNVVAHTADVFGNNWQIGRDNSANADDGSRTYNGIIDEVAVFAQTLTSEQIRSLYVAGSKGPLVIAADVSLGGTIEASAVVVLPHVTVRVTNDLTLRASGNIEIQGNLTAEAQVTYTGARGISIQIEAGGSITFSAGCSVTAGNGADGALGGPTGGDGGKGGALSIRAGQGVEIYPSAHLISGHGGNGATGTVQSGNGGGGGDFTIVAVAGPVTLITPLLGDTLIAGDGGNGADGADGITGGGDPGLAGNGGNGGIALVLPAIDPSTLAIVGRGGNGGAGGIGGSGTTITLPGGTSGSNGQPGQDVNGTGNNGTDGGKGGNGGGWGGSGGRGGNGGDGSAINAGNAGNGGDGLCPAGAGGRGGNSTATAGKGGNGGKGGSGGGFWGGDGGNGGNGGNGGAANAGNGGRGGNGASCCDVMPRKNGGNGGSGGNSTATAGNGGNGGNGGNAAGLFHKGGKGGNAGAGANAVSGNGGKGGNGGNGCTPGVGGGGGTITATAGNAGGAGTGGNGSGGGAGGADGAPNISGVRTPGNSGNKGADGIACTPRCAFNLGIISWHDKVYISWDSGVLMSAPATQGPWTPVLDATNSPYVITPTEGAQFYRLLEY